jgi:drug/metabolite transporter (DMT)-like permease
VTEFEKNVRGIATIVASQFAFIVNDTLVKVTSEGLPLGEIIFLRGALATAFVAGAVLVLGLHREISKLWHRMALLRTTGEIGGTFFYLVALFQMPIGTVTIIFQAVPLSVTAGAALLLGEAVGWRRWSAIVAGFLGVVIVIRPGFDAFEATGLLVLVSVLFVTLRDLATRALPHNVPTLLVTLVTAAAVTIMGLFIGLFEDWVMPSRGDVLSLTAAGLFLSIGYFTVIVAMRIGDMSVTAPFRYSAVVFAIAFGWLVWGDVPDAATIIGSVIIVGAGLYTLYRERRVMRSGEALIAAPAAIDHSTGG